MRMINAIKYRIVLSLEGQNKTGWCLQVHKTASIVFLMLYENMGVVLFSIPFCMSEILPMQVDMI